MVRCIQLGWNCRGFIIYHYYFFFCWCILWFCGHSMRVIPGLVSIPEVKSFCVLFVYYGFSMGISFRCKPSIIYINKRNLSLFIFTNLLSLFFLLLGFAVIAWGLYLVSFRSQKWSLFVFCLCTMVFLWEFHFAASSISLNIILSVYFLVFIKFRKVLYTY